MKKPFFQFVKQNNGAPECDVLCAYRKFYHPDENKGTFTPGVGYTSYFKNPKPVCMTRMLHGCPDSCPADIKKFLEDVKQELLLLKFNKRQAAIFQILIAVVEKLYNNNRGCANRLPEGSDDKA